MWCSPRPVYPFETHDCANSGGQSENSARTPTLVRHVVRWSDSAAAPPATLSPRAPRHPDRPSNRSPLTAAICGHAARAVLATPAVTAAGRPLAVALLIVGLAAMTALMLWVLDRPSSRAARRDGGSGEWDGVRQAAISASGGSERRGAVCEAARGIARADSAQVWELEAGGDLVAIEVA